ncbi:MAG: DUF5668 domain-containing protein [Chloroflexota bacterium]|jgi:hypothetical protein
MSDDIETLKDLEKEFDTTAADLDKVSVVTAGEESRELGHNKSWVPGLVLIAVGGYFLLRNFTDFELNNWWALFILIPAFGSFGNFWRVYRHEGRITGDARGSLIGSMILFFIAAVFLFGWSWGAVWPVFLVIAGIGALLSGLLD